MDGGKKKKSCVGISFNANGDVSVRRKMIKI